VLQAVTRSLKRINASGSVRSGKSLMRPIIFVDEAERAAFRAAQVVAGSIYVVGRGSAPVERRYPLLEPRPTPGDMPRTQWPRVKPPFLRGAFASPFGEVWTLRPYKASARDRIYDAIGQSGEYLRAVAVAPDLALVAIGKQHAYLTHTDEDGVQRIRRYPLTAFSGRL
jgi:hypothetical protein